MVQEIAALAKAKQIQEQQVVNNTMGETCP